MVKPRERRIPIMFSEDELADIDDWRFANRIATRADAVRRLCKMAMFLDSELEQVVDIATGGVNLVADQGAELHEAFRMVINRETFGMTFDRDQIWDVYGLAREHNDAVDEGLNNLHTLLVSIYNAAAAIADAKTMRGAARKSQEIIDKANAAFDQAQKQKVERDAVSRSNWYLALISRTETPEAKAAYEELSEEEQENYLDRRMTEMAAEEAADPSAFAKRYGIDDRKFWEKPEWQELLDRRYAEGDGKHERR